MTILNRTNDGLLSVLLLLHRALIALGPTSRDELLNLCAPATLDKERKVSEAQKQARQTLNRWTQAGLFIEAEEKITVHPDFATSDAGAGGLGSLRAALRKLVLSERNSDGLSNPETESAAVCADFTRALCWVLAQDVYTLPGGGYTGIEEIELSQLKEKPFALQNNTRWDGLKDWAPFLGFGWTSGVDEFVVDPTDAIRDALPAVFGEARELTQGAFLERLASELPVIDGGKYRLEIEERLSDNWVKPGAHEISQSLSRALLRLEIRGVLRLDARADADQRSLLGRGGGSLRRISHVILRGEL
jgi:hypothetical protein